MDNIIERFNLNWIFKNETKKPRPKTGFGLTHCAWQGDIDV